jgi:photosystem II stability/assembly factor-like uncharacterized protein
MKKTILIVMSVFITLVYSQEKAITMGRVESLHSVEAYPVGKIVSINGLGDIFAVNSDNSEVYVLKNGSNTWSRILHSNNDDYVVSNIYSASDNSVFISTESHGLFYSNNTSTYSLTQILIETTAFSVSENSMGTIFCGSTDGLYKSDNNGTTWSITYEYPLKMAINSSDVMYIEEYNKGLCRSSDLGATWEEINYNLSKDIVINDIQTAVDGTVLISVKDNGMYKLNGTEWVSQGFNYANVNSIHAGKNGLLYCSLGDKIYKKTTAVSYWTEIKSTQGRITSFSSNSNKLIAGYTDNLLIFESIDWGSTWTTNGQKIYPTVLSILTVNNYVFVGTDSGVFKSADYGVTWSAKQLSFPIFDIELERYGRVALGTDDGLYRSSDFGLTWVKRTCPVGEIQEVLFTSDYEYYVSGYWGLYKSVDYGSTWAVVPDGDHFSKPYDIEKIDSGRLYIADMHSGVWYTDDEVSWTDSGLGIWTTNIEKNTQSDIYSGVSGALKVLRNGQSTWSTCFSESIFSLFVGSDNVVLAGCSGKLYYSLLGYIWVQTSAGLPASTLVNAVQRDVNGYVYAGMASAKGLYKSNIPLVVK